ncbi:MAG: UDP-glucose 4-epimerase GalE [Oscillospiraceae bacterium]|nr:UDP-glucose 4-epimerase GalE [Oscillospiraceae bacterium]
MSVLVTGGAGYIGTHTALELLGAGCDIVVADDLSNSSLTALERVKELSSRDFKFYNTDLTDPADTETIFEENPEIDSVIHFAGFKAVGESVELPLKYYTNNLVSTLNLLNAMKKHGVSSFVFSSSATVYGAPDSVPVKETFPHRPESPYGKTKLMIEQILLDAAAADSGLGVAILRYFNPIGAHPSGRIGEDPRGIPNNLVPYIAQVAVGKLEYLSVFGDDYETPDGTGVRDYIHVVDLAKGHLAALKKLESSKGAHIYNLGTGRGHSVLEVLHAFERACGKQLPYKVVPRRAGDVAIYYADPEKAKNELGWSAKLGLDEMCSDSWRWQSNNPDGYRK